MKVVLAFLSVLTLVCGSAAIAAAQTAAAQQAPAAGSAKTSATNPDTPEDASDAAIPTPAVQVEFKAHDPVAGAHGTQAFVNPIVCSPDGVPFVAFIEPGSFGMQTVVSLDPKGGHEFSVKAIPDLYDIHSIHGYFASDSMVGVLVRATKDSTKGPNTISLGPGIPPRAVYPGEHHDYLVEFDRDGSYKQAVELPKRYDIRGLAALEDGTLLAMAYDRANLVARLLLMDEDGKILRPLQIPAKMQDSPVLVAGQTADVAAQVDAESSLSWWLFAPARHKVLLYQAHASAPLLEVSSGGAVREVPVEAPKGYVLDGMVPASDRWIVRFRRQGLSDSGEIDARPETGNFELYELDPSDGSLRRRIETDSAPGLSLACEQDGVLTGFAVEDGKVRLETAELPR